MQQQQQHDHDDQHHDDDHHHHNVILPLRLAAEPYAKEYISSSCVSLGIHHSSSSATSTSNTTTTTTGSSSSSSSSSNVELAVLVDDDGIHAFCCNQILSRNELLLRIQSAVPTNSDITTTGWKTNNLYLLIRDDNNNNNNNSNPTRRPTTTTKNPNPNQMRWLLYKEDSNSATPIDNKEMLNNYHQHHRRPVHNQFVAQLITNSIRHYYQQQILEPSVRGFLSVLEKQFSRGDLYLFELLQNAVDDGASIVEFTTTTTSNNNNDADEKNDHRHGRGHGQKQQQQQPQQASSSAGALHMIHNGRKFTPLDVLGLSSVGLSTKSRQGKRTIGFMGVGFKAVYKRYSKVTIDDGCYRFTYQEPKKNNNMGYGWVMLPLWQKQQEKKKKIRSSLQSTTSTLPPTIEDRTGWCHFALEQPRGGYANIKRDLQVLPRTAPPLLGRAALVKMTTNNNTTTTNHNDKWILDWNGKRHTVQRSNINFYDGYDSSSSFNNNNNNDVVVSKRMNGSELITVTIGTDNKQKSTTKENRWLFVTHKYKPSNSARETYHNHTKRSQIGYEELCGFVPLVSLNNNTINNVPHTLSGSAAAAAAAAAVEEGRTNQTTSSQPSGWIHSVLPTKIRMPVPIHFQGSWLLSVDRQHVQDFTGNPWNAELLSKFPNLIATVFRWAAFQKLASSTHYQAICQLMPTTITATATTTKTAMTTNKSSVVDILGQKVSLQALEQAFWSEPILPVGMKTTNTDTKMDVDTTATTTDDDDDIPNIDSLPSPPPTISTSYYEGSKTIWVPPSWFEFLEPDFLRGWLGRRPLRTDFMGKAAYHDIFGLNHVVVQLNPLPNRTSQLAEELGVVRSGFVGRNLEKDTVWKTIRLMAAIGSAYDEHPQKSNTTPTFESSSTNETRQMKKQSKPNNRNNNPSSNPNNNGKSTNDNVEATSNNPPSLPPSISDWPVFITENGKLATLREVVLPGADFGVLPPKLLSKLRPYYFLKEDVASSSSSYRRMKDKRSNKNPAPRKAPKRRIHHSLESTIFAVDRYTTDSEGFEEANGNFRNKVATCASSFLARARELLPTQVIGVTSAASNFLKSYSDKRELSEMDISAILELTKYAFENSNHLLLSHVMVDVTISPGNASTKLVQVSEAYLGKRLDELGTGAALEDFAGPKLQYISSRYNSIIDGTSGQKNAVQLFTLAGVQSGIAISVLLHSNFEKDKHIFEEVVCALPDRKLPALRKNASKADIYIPYGLGQVMTRKKYYLLDSALPKEWERLAKAMSPSSAIGFISLLLSIPFDDATDITPKTVVAANKCLVGQTELNAEKTFPSETGKLPKGTAAPLKRRLYFLPPGQPGAKAINISRSRFVLQLESIKWLPCTMSSHQKGSLTLLRPCEALLEFDPSRPEMPIVSIPPLILKRLKSSLLAKTLTWGTQAPPPPVGELAELAREAERLLSYEPSLVDKDAVADCASRMYDTWNAVCRSHSRDGLSPSDMKTLRMVSALPSIPVRGVLENRGGSANWIVAPTRCIRMPDSIPEALNERERMKNLTVSSLVASDFICDFNHSTHNPFFLQPDLSSAVTQLAGIRLLAEMETNVLIKVCGSFVRHLCATEPNISFRSSPLRHAFSFCMNWCLLNPKELPKRGQGIKVFVRHGPGIGTKRLPARWVPLKGGPVQPVLGDSKLRSALLSPEMNVQLLGVLDHTESEKDCSNAAILSTIDAKVIKSLGILTLSDRRFVVKTRARGTPTVVSNASFKLQLVCALLKSMEIENRLNSTNGNSATTNVFLEGSYEPPSLIRHESLTREFQAPGMDAPSSIQFYAMFGRAPKVDGRCILVSGTPDDYSMELEEIIFDHVGVRSSLSSTQMKPYRAAARLLSHLENDDSFNKFVNRDFADFEATGTWKCLIEKKEILRKLSEAEKDKDRISLRELLVRGEEVFEDDMDGGDSVLQPARDILTKLEEEWKANSAEEQRKRQEAEAAIISGTAIEGRGRGVDNRPAWMTANGSHDNLANNLEISNDNNVSKSPQRKEEATTTVETLAASGRGRGVSNLPAWMTSKDGPSKTDGTLTTCQESNSNESGNSPPLAQLARDNPLQAAKGMGRGVDNRPAWMTSGSPNAPPQEQPLPPTEEAATSTSTDGATLPFDIQAKSIVSSILNATPAAGELHEKNDPQLSVDASAAGRGRGRGVSNLPAWMTNKAVPDCLANGEGDNLKRSRQSKPSEKNPEDCRMEDAEESPAKKQRVVQEEEEEEGDEEKKWPSYNFRVTLDIDLVPSQKAEFMTWLEANAKKEVEVRGGTFKISSNKDSSS